MSLSLMLGALSNVIISTLILLEMPGPANPLLYIHITWSTSILCRSQGLIPLLFVPANGFSGNANV